MSQARGLQNFISDLRNAKSKEDESKRVSKELANIRSKFTASSSLSSYQKKKYVWKLVYAFMLGYDVDFGHAEVVSLVGSAKYSEKQVGYVAMSLLLKAGDSMMNMIVNSIRNDLVGSYDDAATSLALTSIANVSGIELMQALHVEVQRVLVSPNATPAVRKKAALCLLRLIRQLPDSIASADFAPHIANLLQDRHYGVLTSTMSLLIGLTSKHEQEYETMIPYAIHILSTLVLKKSVSPDYLYYRTPSPWLQIKLLRFLQYYPELMSSGEAYVATLKQCLARILNDTDVSDSINKSNADHAVLFEAISTIVVFGDSGDEDLQLAAMRLLGKFISVREPNIRYLGLMTMSRLAVLHNNTNKEQIKTFQSVVVHSLKDADISVRRRALDLLFVMCDQTNAESIVDELITYLVAADAGIREQMVLKIAVLAEKFATSKKWYVDTILKLISISGDQVSDSIWHRVIVIVTNNSDDDLQQYVATTMFDVCSSKNAHVKAVAVGSYVLGEFGFLIAEEAGKSGEVQFQVLHQHWPLIDTNTQGIMLTAFAKMYNLYEEIRPIIDPIFAKLKTSVDVELQQRSNEYRVLGSLGPEIMEDILREMPAFDTQKVSTLEIALDQEHSDTHDVNVFKKKDSEAAKRGSKVQQLQQPEPEILIQPEPEPDLLGGFDEPEIAAIVPPTPPPGNKTSVTCNDPAAVAAGFAKLLSTPQGVLFQNEYVQVGVKQEFRGSQGRVQLFAGNMCRGGDFTNFKITIPEVPYLRTAIQDEMGATNPAGCTVSPKQQARLMIMAEAIAPYSEAPAFTITFETANATHSYPLRLPIVPTSFTEPVTVDKAAFMGRWGQLAPKESQEIVTVSRTVDSAMMQQVAALLTGMKYGRCQEVDSPTTCSGCGTMKTGAKDGQGNPISVGCLVRIEANADKFRVTARTLHPVVSQGVKETFCKALKML
ncbi:hypothetical protein TrLO_g662 [Triparma laevis f. longispina]|uniref:AP-2 complex subunit alpha n=1 Tax=Triparma laevis f. longispina TaxID=1714387 RepID=A0A9W7FSK9_9STRA|nr:hypothetical protein TrLO_g662 [Triparma laevis f. longispina]